MILIPNMSTQLPHPPCRAVGRVQRCIMGKMEEQNKRTSQQKFRRVESNLASIVYIL